MVLKLFLDYFSKRIIAITKIIISPIIFRLYDFMNNRISAISNAIPKVFCWIEIDFGIIRIIEEKFI